ncbi:MAG: class I SAM-dependent RNA methyltransferase [Proteobacteria bacterium]|nr:class I SAM-dependent RNA methyltransferase [Pseudomonadota bacterium]
MLFEVKIEKYAPPGDGLGYYQGKAVFVPGTMIGDIVLVSPVKTRKNHILARVIKILTPAEKRIEPRCPHHELCGACSLLHMELEDQLDLKKAMLLEMLERNHLNVNPVLEPAPSNDNFRYRAQLSYKEGTLGFSQRNSHQVVAVPDCRVLSQGIKEAMKRLPLNRSKNQEFRLLESRSNPSVAAAIVGGKKVTIVPGFPGSVIENYGFGEIELKCQEFAQSNPEVTGKVLETILKNVDESHRVTELFCGSGTFSIPLAMKTKQVFAYEHSREAIRMAKKNARLQDLQNIEFQALDLNKKDINKQVEIIVTDPPRIGMSPSTLKKIIDSTASRIVYVSCNPSTMIRDIKTLTQKGRFVLEEIIGFDMYVHTTHLEVVGILNR